ncbi:hypothetical protein [Nocardia camponoti]|uniref:Uncharacterized protein n=1 Tax=Nocardia camponoti TaxID=1616106 RepID=A0A917Q970_9NOCA|nr:hypothetical protein [Nocardia camponoti]GGK37827.1 hypothetical protein GCM10011591_06800 [Nocardia camponoti]
MKVSRLLTGIGVLPLLARLRRDRDPRISRDPTRPLETAILDAEKQCSSGTLRVSGDPGGDVLFCQGRIVDVKTSGAPGFGALSQHPVGAAHTRLLRMTATVDGIFAIAAGWIDTCDWHTTTGIDTEDGYEGQWVLTEVERRLTALAGVGLSPYRNRLYATLFGLHLQDESTNEIVTLADGNRTCRDLAFLLGRPLYPVTVEVARLLANDILRVAPTAAAEAPNSTNPALPKRQRGASGVNDTLRPRPPQAARPPTTVVDGPDTPYSRSTERIS